MAVGHGGGYDGDGKVIAHGSGHGAVDECDCGYDHGAGHTDTGGGGGHGTAGYGGGKPAEALGGGIGTPLSIFLDFDPDMDLPENFAWKKEAQPISIGTRQNIMELSKAAECVVSAYCRESKCLEYPNGCHLCVNVAWNAKSEDALKPKDLVGDNFANGDTLFIYADMFKVNENGEPGDKANENGKLSDKQGSGKARGNAVGQRAHDRDEYELSIFFDFDPEMKLPSNFVWKKEARPLFIRSRQSMADLARAADRELSKFCIESGFPEYPHGAHTCITVAWNANSDDALTPQDLVGDHFLDEDTLFVYGNMYKMDENGDVAGHTHSNGTAESHGDGHAVGHGGVDHNDCGDCDCGFDHGAGHADGVGHGHGSGHC